MAHLAYVAMLVFCLVATLPLVVILRLRAVRRVRRLVTAIVLAGLPFLVWDLLATAAGHWRFDPAQTLPVRVLGIPLEEIGFFVVVPFAAIVTYEAVGALWPPRSTRGGSTR